MKELVPLAQGQPGVVAVAHSYIRRAAAGHRRIVRAAQPVIDRAQFKCPGRRFQITLIIDQIPACDARWQVTHEYHRQTRVDLGFQTRAHALVAPVSLPGVAIQPGNHASIAADERLDGQGELVDVPIV